MASLSVGDILALIQVGSKIVQILGDTRTAHREVQDAVEGLGHLNEVLIMLAQSDHLNPRVTPEDVPRLNALIFAISQCHNTLDRFYRKLEKYESLAVKKAGKMELVKRAFQKVVWTLVEKGDLATLKTDLDQHKTMISLLLTLSNGNSLRRIEDASESQSTDLSWVVEEMQRHNELLVAVQKSVKKLPPKLGYTWETTEPQFVVLVDLRNAEIPIPMQLCRDREAFTTIISVYSKDRAGQAFVDSGQYELTMEDNTLLVKRNWEAKVEDGMRIYMNAYSATPTEWKWPQKHATCCDKRRIFWDKDGGKCQECNMSFSMVQPAKPWGFDRKEFQRRSLLRSKVAELAEHRKHIRRYVTWEDKEWNKFLQYHRTARKNIGPSPWI